MKNWPMWFIATSVILSFFSGAHFGQWLYKERQVDPHFLQGEEFNMTKVLNQETRLLDLCINAPDMKIPNCDRIYGGVNTTYGEKMTPK